MEPSTAPNAESPPVALPKRRRFLMLPLMLLIFAAGITVGYWGRSEIDQLRSTLLPKPPAVVENQLQPAQGVTVATDLTATAVPTTVTSISVASVTVTETDATTAATPPMLITPTPDRSGEITDFLLANTRHFRGDPSAPVKIIEFSDFQ